MDDSVDDLLESLPGQNGAEPPKPPTLLGNPEPPTLLANRPWELPGAISSTSSSKALQSGRGSATSEFSKMLQSLDAEHMREVAELQREVAQLSKRLQAKTPEPAAQPQAAGEPEGSPLPKRFCVTIVSADGLRNADWISVSDPYCGVQVHGRPETLKQTNTVQDSTSPVWNSKIVLQCEASDNLQFVVKDKDLLKKDDILGSGLLTHADFFASGFDGEICLADPGSKLRPTLRVRVEVAGDPQKSSSKGWQPAASVSPIASSYEAASASPVNAEAARTSAGYAAECIDLTDDEIVTQTPVKPRNLDMTSDSENSGMCLDGALAVLPGSCGDESPKSPRSSPSGEKASPMSRRSNTQNSLSASGTGMVRGTSHGEMLSIDIISAEGLRSADWGLNASSDPYVVCEIPFKPWSKCQTPVLERNLDPIWDYQAILVDWAEDDDLVFTVRDRDWGAESKDDLLGRCTLQASMFWPDGFEGELQLGEAGRGYNPTLTVKVDKFVPNRDFRAEELLTQWREPPTYFRQTSVATASFGVAGSGGTRSLAGRTTLGDLHARLPSRYIVKPDANYRVTWDMIGIWVLLVDLIWIPMQVFQIPDTPGVLAVFWVKLVYWSGDIVFTFNTGFYSGTGGQMVLRRKQIFFNYLKGWLLFDLFLVTIDWSTVIQKWLSDSSSGVAENAGAARAGKLARIMKVVRLLRLMRLAKLRALLYTVQGLIDSEWLTIVFVVGKNLMSIIVLNHYLGCAWFMIGNSHAPGYGWVERMHFDTADWSVQYLVSLHWSLTQFTPGKSLVDAETHGERGYCTFVLILSMVVATCFVSSITSALGQIWSMNRYTATQSFLLKKFLTQNHISRSLGARVTRYVDGVIEIRHTKLHPSKVEYLMLISGPLNIELNREMRLPKLIIHPLFQMYSVINSAVTGQVCTIAAVSTYFGRHDVLFKEGSQADSMYFVGLGTLAYRYFKSGRKPITTKLEANQWCCEGALWMHWVHRGQLKAVAHVDVTILNGAKFMELTIASEDTYKFARGCAYQFLNNSDNDTDTDIPKFSDDEDGAQDTSGTSAALSRVREAEDAEVQTIQFD